MKTTSLVILCGIIGGTACAGQRVSANYTILTYGVADGGKRTTPAAYTNYGSAGVSGRASARLRYAAQSSTRRPGTR